MTSEIQKFTDCMDSVTSLVEVAKLTKRDIVRKIEDQVQELHEAINEDDSWNGSDACVIIGVLAMKLGAAFDV